MVIPIPVDSQNEVALEGKNGNNYLLTTLTWSEEGGTIFCCINRGGGTIVWLLLYFKVFGRFTSTKTCGA